MAREEQDRTDSQLKYADLLLRKGMQQEAQGQLQEVLRRDPGCARAHYALAVALTAQGDPGQAAEHFQRALELEPDQVKSLNGLGVAYQQLGESDKAVACYQRAVRVDPLYQDAQINLALMLKSHDNLCDAERQLEQALRVQPASARLRYNLANILHLQGRSLDAVAAYRETLRLDPEHLDARQNLLFALHYSTRCSEQEIFQEHLEAARLKAFRPDAVRAPRAERAARDGKERIRLGYLSPDFRSHAVACFIEPILAHHDKSRFEVFCYANLPRPDRTTERLKGLAEHWRDICGVGDQEAARTIADDRIDILVDLAGHTSGNRLPLFARRPAPLQVTWLGYPDTTGLDALHYRITDRFADPPGTTERYHTERLVRLERTFCCYLPPDPCPEVGTLPALRAGRITFGSFNNLAKVTPELIALWGRVLQAVPGSRILLKCRPLADPEVCIRVLNEFRRAGVAADRVELHPANPDGFGHLAQYGAVDIALDSFPYNGTTTSCEALWMGVPVVTLAGVRHASRTGVSILENVGLGHLVAATPQQYPDLAAQLARDLGALQELRSGLRERMRRSPLLDGAGVTRELEQALLRMLEGEGG